MGICIFDVDSINRTTLQGTFMWPEITNYGTYTGFYEFSLVPSLWTTIRYSWSKYPSFSRYMDVLIKILARSYQGYHDDSLIWQGFLPSLIKKFHLSYQANQDIFMALAKSMKYFLRLLPSLSSFFHESDQPCQEKFKHIGSELAKFFHDS